METPIRTGAGERPPAILLGGLGSTLSVVRSLSRAGVQVYVLGDARSVTRFSRHCAEFVDLGNGDGIQERWLSWLETGPRGAVLLTCHDDGLELVARNRGALVELGYKPLEADDDVLLAMLDKHRTYELARKAGIPAPRTWPVADETALEAVLGEVQYPCALKPRESHIFAKRFGAKLLVADDEDQLRESFVRTRQAGLGMLLTELVPGGDKCVSYYSFIDERGEPLFHLTKRKLRQFPPGQGPGTYHLTDWNPEVAELGLRVLQGVGLRGLGVPEFKRDPRDGELKLIEVNHRFTNANELVRASGIDLALLTYNRLAGLPPPRLDGYRHRQGLWFAGQDLRAFMAYRGLDELTLAAWLRSLANRQRPPLFAWDDPLPSLANMSMRLARALRRGRGAIDGGGASPVEQ